MIKWIVICLLGLILLGYLGFDIRRAVEAPVSQSNIEYVKDVIVYVWNTYCAGPVKYLWNKFVTLIWNTAVNNLTNSINATSTVQTSTP
jgi:hypothetical protein